MNLNNCALRLLHATRAYVYKEWISWLSIFDEEVIDFMNIFLSLNILLLSVFLCLLMRERERDCDIDKVIAVTQYMCVWCQWKSERVLDPLELGLQIIVNCHVVASNHTLNLCKSNKCFYCWNFSPDLRHNFKAILI